MRAIRLLTKIKSIAPSFLAFWPGFQALKANSAKSSTVKLRQRLEDCDQNLIGSFTVKSCNLLVELIGRFSTYRSRVWRPLVRERGDRDPAFLRGFIARQPDVQGQDDVEAPDDQGDQAGALAGSVRIDRFEPNLENFRS
jgi:hypothetical protein